jgi:hypothetical protein
MKPTRLGQAHRHLRETLGDCAGAVPLSAENADLILDGFLIGRWAKASECVCLEMKMEESVRDPPCCVGAC